MIKSTLGLFNLQVHLFSSPLSQACTQILKKNKQLSNKQVCDATRTFLHLSEFCTKASLKTLLEKCDPNPPVWPNSEDSRNSLDPHEQQSL